MAFAEDARKWWSLLASWPGPDTGLPRTLTELARRSRNAAIVFSGSPHYLRALRDDLTTARRELANPAALIVVSTGSERNSPEFSGLQDAMMACDARWLPELGGTRISLNARVAKRLLQDADYQAGRLPDARAAMEQRLVSLPVAQRPVRERNQSPEQVEAFVRYRLAVDPAVGHTTLLREFRAQGRAFEYKRFRALVREVREGLNAAQGG